MGFEGDDPKVIHGSFLLINFSCLYLKPFSLFIFFGSWIVGPIVCASVCLSLFFFFSIRHEEK